MHVVAVKVVEYKYVVIFRGRNIQETVSLIYEYLTGPRETICKYGVGATAS